MPFERIGPKLRQLRELKNMSQQQLADASGLHAETIYNIEAGKVLPQNPTITALAYGLGVTIRELKEPVSDNEVQFWVFLDKFALMPKKAHEEDAGFDLYAPIPGIVPKHGSTVMDTGVHIAIPSGYAGMIVSKSGLNFSHDIISDGLIDAGYTGSIHVKLYNLGDTSFLIERGDKISQLVFVPIVSPDLIQTTDINALGDTERGARGFGSSGRK